MAPYVAFISIAAPRSKFDTPTLRTCFFWADFWNNIEYIGSNYICHKWYQQMKSQFRKGLYGIVKIRTCCPSAPHDQNVSFKCCHGNTMHKTMGKYYRSCCKVRAICCSWEVSLMLSPVQGQLLARIRWRNFNSCRNMCFTTTAPSQADPQIPLRAVLNVNFRSSISSKQVNWSI